MVIRSNMSKDILLKAFGGIVCFLLSVVFITHLPIAQAPDEYMRLDIPFYIFEHDSLPIGNEEEIVNDIWGFSYAFTPYLPSLVGVFFMKILSIFTVKKAFLVIACRMPQAFAMAGIWIFTYRISEKIFEKHIYRLMLCFFVCFLPQVVFLSGYLNNDIFSILFSAMIIDAWIIGYHTDWSIGTCIYLAIGIGLMALTYYNAFGYILCSVAVYFISYLRKKGSFWLFLKKGILIALIVFLICGWFYIRNYIIHNGDFLGMDTMYELGEQLAQEPYKMSMRDTPNARGYSFYETFFKETYFDKTWVRGTIYSFIGYFGYTTVMMSEKIYDIYLIIICLAIVALVSYFFSKKYHMSSDKIVKINRADLYINLIICMLIPLGLSMHYSYYIDYQAQGRYIISAIIPLMIFVTYGYGCVDKYVYSLFYQQKNAKYLVSYIVLVLWIILLLKALFVYMIPNLFGNIL